MINRNRRDQSGHAALLFALMIPLLFGVFILGTDGARALQSKARLEEASEAAALAIAGQSESAQESRDALASRYIRYYFPHSDIIRMETQNIPCSQNQDCEKITSATEQYFEYTVSTNIEQKNWFSNDTIATSMGDGLNVGGYSQARKYQSQAVDVILVADFSGSMQDRLPGENKNKEQQLIEVMKEVADTLNDYNQHSNLKSELAFTGFNFFTKKYTFDSNDLKYYNYLICKKAYQNQFRQQGWCFDSYENGRNIDVNATVSQIFDYDAYDYWTEKQIIENNSWGQDIVNARFREIPLTDDFSKFKREISQFYAKGGTASYTGLISGARLAYDGDNQRKLIILLSDGQDSNYFKADDNISSALIYKGKLCSVIISKLNEKLVYNDSTQSNEHVVSKMFAIGFGYAASDYPVMQQCVGQGNVYDAKNSEAIKDKILELIAEEMGRLSPSD